MLEKILNKIPYVKELKHENDILRETNHTWKKEARKILDKNEMLKSENQELRSYVGYLVNEPHIVMENKDGRYFPVDPSTLEKYQDVEIKKVHLPPWNHLRIYTKIGKSTHNSTQ